MEFVAHEIGARIQQARKERGLTQEELAGMASFSKRSLQDYENGVTLPYRHLREIGQLLGRPTQWFLRGDELTPTLEERLEERLEQIQAQLGEIRAMLDDADGQGSEAPAA